MVYRTCHPASLFCISGSPAEPQAEIPGGWLLVCVAVSMTCLYQITGHRFGVVIWKVIFDSVRGLGLLFHKRVLRYNEVISDVKWMRYMSSFPDHSPLLQNTHTHTGVSTNRNNPAPHTSCYPVFMVKAPQEAGAEPHKTIPGLHLPPGFFRRWAGSEEWRGGARLWPVV